MSAQLTAGIDSLNLTVPFPKESDEVTPRDDLIGIRVWYSTVSGFTPPAQGTLAYDGQGLDVTITGLNAGTIYYVKYALISEIDPGVYDVSDQLTGIPVYETQTVDPTPPPTPSGITITGGVGAVFVNQIAPTYTQGRGHARTLVYGRSYASESTYTSPVFADAIQIGEFSGNVWSFPSDPALKWHLWFRWQAVSGVFSVEPFGGVNGLQATTAVDVGRLLEALSGEITSSELNQSLSSRIDLVDAPTTGLVTKVSTLQSSDNQLFAQYTVKIDSNGFVSGFGLASETVAGTTTSDFQVRADRFSITNPAVSLVNINSLTRSTTTATLTAQSAHGLVVGDTITIRGVTNDTKWNGTYTVLTQPSTTQITFTVPSTLTTPATITSAKVGKSSVPFIVKNGQTVIQSALIEDASITTAKINNLAVTGAKIANATITDANIGSLNADKITTGTLSADRIAADSITASKIDSRNLTIKDAGGTVIFSSGQNLDFARVGGATRPSENATGGAVLNIDRYFKSSSSWTSYNGAGEFVTITDGTSGTTAVRTPNSGAQVWMNGIERLPIDFLKTYVVKAYLRTVSGTGKVVFMGVALFDSAGNNISGDGDQWFYAASSVQPGSSWTEYTGFFGKGTAKAFPNNAVTMTPLFILSYGSGTSIHQIQDLRIEETISAEKFTGGLGTNLLRNSEFQDGIAGWGITYHNTGLAPVASHNLGSDYNLRGSGLAYSYVSGSPSTNLAFDFGQFELVPILPGERYEAFGLLNTHRCTASVVIGWYDSAKAYISEIGGNSVNFASSVYTLSDLRFSGLFATAPASARFARIWARGITVSDNPYVFIKNLYFGNAGISQTTHSTWTPGQALNQITTTNASTYIQNAAIGSAQIADANITTAKIADANITTAKIGTAQVNTLRIGLNAVTVPTIVQVANVTGIPGSQFPETYGFGGINWKEVANVYVDLSAGGSVILMASAVELVLSNSAYTFYGSIIDPDSIIIAASASAAAYPTLVSKADKTGTYRFRLAARGGGTWTASNITLVAIGAKR